MIRVVGTDFADESCNPFYFSGYNTWEVTLLGLPPVNKPQWSANGVSHMSFCANKVCCRSWRRPEAHAVGAAHL